MTEKTNTETGVATDQGGGNNFPPFDSSTFTSQLLWLAITFGLLYYLMAKVALPRISGILEVRSDRIAQDLGEAERLKDESDAAIAAYEQELAEARSSAHGIAQEARDKAKAEADAERSKVEAGLANKLAKAESRISDIKQEALKDVNAIASETAELLVSQLIGGKASKSEITKAVSSAATAREI